MFYDVFKNAMVNSDTGVIEVQFQDGDEVSVIE